MHSNNYQFIVSQSELGAGTRGASKGYEALLKAAEKHSIDWFKPKFVKPVANFNDALKIPIQYPFAKRIEPLFEVFKNIANTVEDVISGHQSPIIISGDHSSATGTIAGIKKAIGDKRLGVIWIDAHADLHTPYTTPTGNMHGMPLGASLGLNHNLPNGNNPSEAVKKLWDDIKQLGGVSPKFNAEHLIYVGVRDIEWQEEKVIKDLDIQRFNVDFIRQNGGATTAEKILNRLINVDYLYISFDVDVLDPSISTATGTPVDNGLYLREALNLVKGLTHSDIPKCFELVEINPTKENNENKMAEAGLKILEIVQQNI